MCPQKKIRALGALQQETGIKIFPTAKPSITVETGDSAATTLAELGCQVRTLLDSESAQRALADQLNAGHRLLGVDIETTGLDPLHHKIRLAQVASPDGQVLVFDLAHLPIGLLEPLMAQPWIAHNAGFEWRFLKAAGLQPGTPQCTYIMSRVAAGHGLSLAEAAKQTLGIEVAKALQTSDWTQTELSPAQVNYAALDAVLTLKLARPFADTINATRQQTAYRVFQEALPVVAQQMLDGVPFDREAHKGQIEGWQAELEPLQQELHRRLGGINPNSGPQLAGWLQQTLDASLLDTWPLTRKGRLKTDLNTFQSAQGLPMIEPLLHYKLLRKRLTTYGDKFATHIHPVTGRIHADFILAGTRSGRFRCTHPNLQNPPRDKAFRSLFAAPEGYRLVVADYSQVELRIAALLAPDRAMLEAYEQGQDLHKKTAAAVMRIPMEQVTNAQRQMAKAVNFGLTYSMGAAGLAAYAQSSYGVTMTLEQATAARNAFFKAYPGIRDWHVRTKAQGKFDPTVHTQSGLIRDFSQEPFGFKLTEALNTPIQGSGAECLLRSLARLPKHLAGLDAKLIHHVHDEIILEVAERDVPAAKQALTDAMVEGFLAVFPGACVQGLVEAHAGKHWAEAK